MTPGASGPRAARIEISADPARLDALRPEWDALLDDAGVPSPFLSHAWLATFQEVLAPRRAVRILEARGPAGRLEGLLLLQASRSGRRWSLLGNGLAGADGLDLLVRPDRRDAAGVRHAVAGALLDLAGWDALDLEDLPAGSRFAAALRGAATARGLRVRVERRFACPCAALAGSYDAHLSQVRRRETFGRRVRWLSRQPGFAIRVAASPEEAPAAMDDFLRLHRLRWAAEGGSYGIPAGPLEDFHRAVAPRLAARGWLRLYLLSVGRVPVAAIYGIEAGGTFHFYQSGYDPAWSVRSPGQVLLGRTFEDAFARGLRAYDFLRGEEAYKLDWAWDRRETCAVRVRAPSLRARGRETVGEVTRAVKGLARATVPAGWWGTLQRARRSVEAGAGR